jgi:hypothetical protein
MHGDVVDAAHVDRQADGAGQRNDQQGKHHCDVAGLLTSKAADDVRAGGDALGNLVQCPLE